MTQQNKIGLILSTISIILFIGALGLFEILSPVISNFNMLILSLGLILMLSILISIISVIKSPKISYLPFILILFWISFQLPNPYQPKNIKMLPPPEWSTYQSGWPFLSNGIVTHTINRIVVEEKIEIYWAKAIMNFSLCAFIGGIIISIRQVVNRINKS